MIEPRRSANYCASIWDDNFVQSLTAPYSYLKKWEELKDEVQVIVDETTDEMDQLELIDNLIRLHITDHLKDRVERILESIHRTRASCPEKKVEVQPQSHPPQPNQSCDRSHTIPMGGR